MQDRFDGPRRVKPHQVERVGILECCRRRCTVEERDIGDLTDKDDAEEEGDGAEDGGLEEAHGDDCRGRSEGENSEGKGR